MNPNSAQLIGALRGIAVAIGGALIGAGVINLTTEQLNALISQGTSVVVAIAGLVAVVAPMIQAWRGRTTTAIVQKAAEQPGVLKIEAVPKLAKDVPSDKVVPPSGA